MCCKLVLFGTGHYIRVDVTHVWRPFCHHTQDMCLRRFARPFPLMPEMTTLNCFPSLGFTWLGLLYYQTWPGPLELVQIKTLLQLHASWARAIRFILVLGMCLRTYPTPLAPLASFRSSRVGNGAKISVSISWACRRLLKY